MRLLHKIPITNHLFEEKKKRVNVESEDFKDAIEATLELLAQTPGNNLKNSDVKKFSRDEGEQTSGDLEEADSDERLEKASVYNEEGTIEKLMTVFGKSPDRAKLGSYIVERIIPIIAQLEAANRLQEYTDLINASKDPSSLPEPYAKWADSLIEAEFKGKDLTDRIIARQQQILKKEYYRAPLQHVLMFLYSRESEQTALQDIIFNAVDDGRAEQILKRRDPLTAALYRYESEKREEIDDMTVQVTTILDKNGVSNGEEQWLKFRKLAFSMDAHRGKKMLDVVVEALKDHSTAPNAKADFQNWFSSLLAIPLDQISRAGTRKVGKVKYGNNELDWSEDPIWQKIMGFSKNQGWADKVTGGLPNTKVGRGELILAALTKDSSLAGVGADVDVKHKEIGMVGLHVKAHSDMAAAPTEDKTSDISGQKAATSQAPNDHTKLWGWSFPWAADEVFDSEQAKIVKKAFSSGKKPVLEATAAAVKEYCGVNIEDHKIGSSNKYDVNNIKNAVATDKPQDVDVFIKNIIVTLEMANRAMLKFHPTTGTSSKHKTSSKKPDGKTAFSQKEWVTEALKQSGPVYSASLLPGNKMHVGAIHKSGLSIGATSSTNFRVSYVSPTEDTLASRFGFNADVADAKTKEVLSKDEYSETDAYTPDKEDLDKLDTFWEWLKRFDGQTPINRQNPGGEKYPNLNAVFEKMKKDWDAAVFTTSQKKEFIMNLSKRAFPDYNLDIRDFEGITDEKSLKAAMFGNYMPEIEKDTDGELKIKSQNPNKPIRDAKTNDYIYYPGQYFVDKDGNPDDQTKLTDLLKLIDYYNGLKPDTTWNKLKKDNLAKTKKAWEDKVSAPLPPEKPYKPPKRFTREIIEKMAASAGLTLTKKVKIKDVGRSKNLYIWNMLRSKEVQITYLHARKQYDVNTKDFSDISDPSNLTIKRKNKKSGKTETVKLSSDHFKSLLQWAKANKAWKDTDKVDVRKRKEDLFNELVQAGKIKYGNYYPAGDDKVAYLKLENKNYSLMENLYEDCGDIGASIDSTLSFMPVEIDHSDEGRNLGYGNVKTGSKEGRMTKSKLFRISKYSQSLHDRLQDEDDLPEWVQDKITTAADRMSSVYHYIDYKLHRMKADGIQLTENRRMGLLKRVISIFGD